MTEGVHLDRDVVHHGSVEHEVVLEAPLERVFAAFADPDLRARWFRMPGCEEYKLDFRIGGGERVRGRLGDEEIAYESSFWEMVPDARLVFSYATDTGGIRRWVSLVTVEFAAEDDGSVSGGTRLSWHEQYVFLAPTGADDVAHLEGSVRLQMNGLSYLMRMGAM